MVPVKGFAADTNLGDHKKVGGLGSETGPLKLKDGKVIEGGRVMMSHQWNTVLYPRLADAVDPQDIRA